MAAAELGGRRGHDIGAADVADRIRRAVELTGETVAKALIHVRSDVRECPILGVTDLGGSVAGARDESVLEGDGDGVEIALS